MGKKIKYIFAFLVTIIIDLVFIPIKGYGNYNKLYGRDNIYNLIKQNSCDICLNYQISILHLIIQSILIFTFVILLFKVFSRKEKNNG